MRGRLHGGEMLFLMDKVTPKSLEESLPEQRTRRLGGTVVRGYGGMVGGTVGGTVDGEVKVKLKSRIRPRSQPRPRIEHRSTA